MIFLTVGSQLPFERMVKSVDAWAADHPDVEIYAQIGLTKYHPKHMPYTRSLTPMVYKEKFESALFVIAHAGMGTIISALEIGKSLLVVPRKMALGEHRTDHQLATIKHFRKFEMIHVAEDDAELHVLMSLMQDKTHVEDSVDIQVSQTLINKIKDFVAS